MVSFHFLKPISLHYPSTECEFQINNIYHVGLNSLNGLNITSLNLAMPPQDDGINMNATIFISNPSVVSLHLVSLVIPSHSNTSAKATVSHFSARAMSPSISPSTTSRLGRPGFKT